MAKNQKGKSNAELTTELGEAKAALEDAAAAKTEAEDRADYYMNRSDDFEAQLDAPAADVSPPQEDVQDVVRDGRVAAFGKPDLDVAFQRRHDGAPVFVDETHPDVMLPFLHPVKADAVRDGTLRVDGRELVRADGIERAQDIELAVLVFGGCVAQGRDFHFHG